MRLPVIKGLIDRRILVNYRVDPAALAELLPPPFEPKRQGGMGIAGICLIRFSQIRPTPMPAWMGLRSENAAHRIAVEWRDGGKRQEGVYITRRDTSAWINAFAGGRVFPGIHHHAHFDVEEDGDRYAVALQSDDGLANIEVVGHRSNALPAESAFSDLNEASEFFQQGSVGYSPRRDPTEFDGIELHTHNWQVEPLAVERVRSHFFDTGYTLPRGAAEFDHALLMQRIDHEWHDHGIMKSPPVDNTAGSSSNI